MEYKIYLTIFIYFVTTTTQASNIWKEPHFIDPENGIVKFNTTQEEYQQISMDEEVAPNITLAFINYEAKDHTPEISSFTEGVPEMLGAIISYNEAKKLWEIIITKKIDYEKLPGRQRFLFSVKIENDIKRIALAINNIDDNPPVIEVYTVPCQIEENYKGVSNCLYKLSDADGWLPNMTFTIKGSKNESKLFEFKYNTTQPLSDKDTFANVSLHVIEELDFETISVYSFEWYVEDTGKNNVTEIVLIKVIDMPDMPPKWTSIFSAKTFDEKEPQTFRVAAIDGDIEVKWEINYKLNSSWDELFYIDSKTGVITVPKGIDRDTLERELFEFEIIAYEIVPDGINGTSLNETQEVSFLVKDVNDNYPTINTTNESLWSNNRTLTFHIDESKITPLDVLIEIEDRDVGKNAMYEVSLLDETNVPYSRAFQIIPFKGYQKWEFSLAIINSTLLDYEDKEWQNFRFKIFVQEDQNPSHTDVAWVQIALFNWNDELPIFNQSEYVVHIQENITKESFIASVIATDRDVDDWIDYHLLGTAVNNILSIEKNEIDLGIIKTIKDNAFDYEKQTQIVVQVQAQDNLHGIHNKALAQLVINVIDVNDETPKIQMVMGINITENSIHNTLISKEVTATDEDTTAHLNFSIIWSSSYALKRGQPVAAEKLENYIGSVIVKAVNISNNPTGYARAELYNFETVLGNTPDYEIFDTLFLNLSVTDLNQEIGESTASALLTIKINDVNDNPPIFEESTIFKNYTVTEGTNIGQTIGTIIAIDPDDPPFNKVFYSLQPLGLTPEDWVKIDPKEGLLTANSKNIDADDPPIWYLNYLVIANDTENKSHDMISIYIIDTNTKYPKIKSVEKVIYLLEKSPANKRADTKIEWSDGDRDAPYNQIWYRLTSTNENVTDSFRIDKITGEIVVKIGGSDLDRDFGISEYAVDFEIVDNLPGPPSQQLSDKGSFVIKLVDINDQTPNITTRVVNTIETLKQNENIIETIKATDADEPGNNNSKIQFEIKKISKGEGADKEPPKNLFSIKSDPNNDNGEATLIANYNLNGYYGQYDLLIQVNDMGDNPNYANYTVQVNVAKYNFHPPKFNSPPNDTNIYYLSKNNEAFRRLILYNSEAMPYITADDQQGGKKWNIKFEIVEDTRNTEGNIHDIFFIDNRDSLGRSTGELQLKTTNFDKNKPYKFTIKANDGGSPPYTATADMIIHFYDEGQQPHFSENQREITVAFKENKTGLGEQNPLYQASYNNITEFPIFYILTPSEDSKYFSVDKRNGTITVIEELDYEKQKQHKIEIVASNNENKPSSDEESKLAVTVNVIDINDNEPYFNTSFFGIITSGKAIDDRVLTIVAYDEDEHDSLRYFLVEGSMQKNGTGLSEIREPFKIIENTGAVILKFQVLQSMTGYFQFTVKAVDDPPEEHSAITSVKIFIVSEKNRVEFKFESSLEIIEKMNNTIVQILEKHFGYICNIERIGPDAHDNGEPMYTRTVVTTYFIDENTNEPVLKEVILNRAMDVVEFRKLKAEFLSNTILLLGFNTDVTENNLEAMLKAWLIGVSVVLGSISVILLIAFIVKTRSLTNRLNNLSNIKFGSQESGINRIGVAAPTTNKHAVEGSNPVFNEKKSTSEFDRASIASGDSDLIGVEDNPEFDYFPEKIDNYINNYSKDTTNNSKLE